MAEKKKEKEPQKIEKIDKNVEKKASGLSLPILCHV